MNNRICTIGITIENRKESAGEVNQILTDFGDIIVGRMGVPYRERKVSVIVLMVDGTNDQVGALSGKLGQIKEVKVKSAILI